MPMFITMYNFTDQGVRNIKDAPKRIAAAIKSFESMGGTMHGFYSTTGIYDYVSVSEASEEVGAAFAMAVGMQGNVRSTTMRAFTVEEFANIVSKLP